MLRDSFHELQPEDWCFEGLVMWLRLPDGDYTRIPLKPLVPGWDWNGQVIFPTLAQSIDVKDHWHGWMIEGKLHSVETIGQKV